MNVIIAGSIEQAWIGCPVRQPARGRAAEPAQGLLWLGARYYLAGA
jgi:hypothetical protein